MNTEYRAYIVAIHANAARDRGSRNRVKPMADLLLRNHHDQRSSHETHDVGGAGDVMDRGASDDDGHGLVIFSTVEATYDTWSAYREAMIKEQAIDPDLLEPETGYIPEKHERRSLEET